MRTQILNGERINLTAEEETERNAEEAVDAIRIADEAAAAAANKYRLDRKRRYINELGKGQGNFQNTVGDVLDILIAEIAAPGTQDFQDLLAKIAQIKQDIPKP